MARHRIVVLVAGVAAVLVAGCDTPTDGSEDPAAALRGTWTISTNTMTDGAHHTLQITTDDEYVFRDESDTIFERGTMTRITGSSFECEITEYTPDPPPSVGDENYAEYNIVDDDLTITWYDDNTRETQFVRFTATRN